MIPYILTYLTLSLVAFLENSILTKKIFNYLYYFLIIYLILFCGYRFNVGGDWNYYIETFFYTDKFELNFLGLLIAFSKYINLSFANHNLLISIIFFSYLMYLIKEYKNKLFILSCSFPILIFISHMGFVKQSLAIIFLVNSIFEYKKENYNHSIILFFLSVFAHYSSLIFIFFFINKKLFKNRYSIILCLIFVFLIIFNLDIILNKIRYFLFDFEFASSKGAYLRVTLVFMMSLFLFLVKNTLDLSNEYSLLLYFVSLTSLIFFILIIFFPNFTLIDRLNYYLIPFMYFFIDKFLSIQKNNIQLLCKLFVIILNFIVLIVWLNYAKHNIFWLPYKNYLLMDIN